MSYPYDYIILDFRGTLCTFVPDLQTEKQQVVKGLIETAYAHLQYPAPASEMITAQLSQSYRIEEVFGNLTPNATTAQMEQLLEAYAKQEREQVAYHTQIIPGVAELLKAIYKAGITMIIVSFQSAETIQTILDRVEIADYITKIIATQAKDLRKPNRAIYDQLIKPTFPDIQPNRTMVVGDETADILFAQNIGATACWAYYGGGDFDKCRVLTPDYTIYHPKYLLDIIFKQ